MIKKKKFKKIQILIKKFFLKNEIKKLINKSLWKNHQNNYQFRLSFCINNFYLKKKNFFKSHQKLICLHKLEKKIPSQKLHYSRFFLNKQLNTLLISNMYK